jgi:Domain of unknown function (DUF374)
MLDAPLPRESAVWIGWHEGNLLALALHGRVTNRGAMAFVPPGFNGAAMQGWLEALGVTPVPLAADARRGLGLRQMEAALAAGKDVLIAVDGPRGPRHHIAPGAMWLARATGVEIRPVGCAAWPVLRLPRWGPPNRAAARRPGWPCRRRHLDLPGRGSWIGRGVGEACGDARGAVLAEHGVKPTEAAPWH